MHVCMHHTDSLNRDLLVCSLKKPSHWGHVLHFQNGFLSFSSIVQVRQGTLCSGCSRPPNSTSNGPSSRRSAERNPGSVWRFDKARDGVTFKRACFIPHVGIYIANISKRLIRFDGDHLTGEMNKRGIFLVATCKDFNNPRRPVRTRSGACRRLWNWRWFMACIKTATDLECFAAVSDGQ